MKNSPVFIVWNHTTRRRGRRGLWLTLLCVLLSLLPAAARVVTIGTASGRDNAAAGLTTATRYSSAESVYTLAEIGGGGSISRFALNKASGDTNPIDSVSIYMKETSDPASATVSLAGYTLVYKGDFPNSTFSSWVSVALTAPFVYTGTGNLNVLIVRYNGTPIASYARPIYYGDPSGPFPRYYRSGRTDYWSDWPVATATAYQDRRTYSFRPQIQLELDPLPACSARPVAGKVVATVPDCTGQPATFRLSGSAAGVALNYNWDTSANGSSGWALAATSSIDPGSWSFFPPAGRTLYYRCRVSCGTLADTSDTISLYGPVSLTPPYEETFETVVPEQNVSCAGTTAWSYVTWYTMGEPISWMPQLDNHTPGGSKWLKGGYNLSAAAPDFWFSPAIQLEAGRQYQLSYWYNTDGQITSRPFEFGAYIGTAQNAAAMTTAIGPVIRPGSPATYQQYAAEFTVPASGSFYIGIYGQGNGYEGFALDDISLQELSPCSGSIIAGVISASPERICGSGSTVLELREGTAATDLTYTWLSRAGTSGWTPAGTGKPPFTTAVLSQDTWFRCVVACPSSGNADTSDELLVPAGTTSLPYLETFEGLSRGTNATCAGATNWAVGSGWCTEDGMPYWELPSLDNHTPGGSMWLRAGAILSLSGSPDFWFSPPLSLTAGKTYHFSYWYNTNGKGSPDYPFELGAYIGSSQDAAAMSTPIGPVIKPGAPTVYQEYATEFTATTSGIYYLGIYASSDNGYGMAIDDISLQELEPCTGSVTAGNPTSNTKICGTGTITLRLEGTTAATDLTYTWLYRTSTSGAWTVAGSAKPPYTTATITQDTWFCCVVSCPSSGSSDTSSEILIEAGPLIPPYLETFETTEEGKNAECAGASAWGWGSWQTRSGPLDLYAYPGMTNHTPGGNMWLIGFNGLSATAADFWFTPMIRLEGGKPYQFSFWYSTTGGLDPVSSELGAYIGTDQTAAAMTTAIGPVIRPGSPDFYQQYVTTYTPAASGNYYIGIYAKANPSGALAIDDIGLQEAFPCSGSVTAGNTMALRKHICGSGSTQLSLEGSTLASGLSYTWIYRNTPSGVWALAGSGAPPFTSPVISSNTWFRCVVTCTASGLSDTSSEVLVTAGIRTLPYLETFETAVIPGNTVCAGATRWGYGSWRIISGPYNRWSLPWMDNHTPGGSQWLQGGGNISTSGDKDYWFTPGLQLNAGSRYRLSYWYITDGYTNPASPFIFGAYMGTDQTASGMTIPLGPEIMSGAPKTYQLFTTDFVAPATSTYYIGIYARANNRDGLGIDDISVQQLMPCSGTVTGGMTTALPEKVCGISSTTLNLAGLTAASDLKYTWIYRTAGSSWIIAGTDEPPFNSPPITEDTWFRCIVSCPGSGHSDTSSEVLVRTGILQPPYLETFEDVSINQNATCASASIWSPNNWITFANPYFSAPYLTNHTPGGRVWLRGGNDISSGSYWFSPALKLKAGLQYLFSYWYNTDGYLSPGNPFRFGAYLGTAQNDAAMTTSIGPLISPGVPDSYQQYNTEFNVGSSGIYYIGIYARSNGFYGLAIDDISLNYKPCDGPPNAGFISSRSPSGKLLCKGTAVSLSGKGISLPETPGIGYQWERRLLKSSASWEPVAGATDTVLSGDTLIGYEYRLAVICGNTQDTSRTASFGLPEAPPHPAVAISPATSPAMICLGDTLHFRASYYKDATYEWTRDNTVIPGWSFNDMNTTEPGVYRVKAISPLSTCPARSDSVVLTRIVPDYSVALSKVTDSFLCAGDTVILSAAASKPGLSYQWRKDNLDISGATGTYYKVWSSGIYKVTVSDGKSGCPAQSRSVNMKVKPNPPIRVITPGGMLTACAEPGLRLSVSEPAFSYQWIRNGIPVFGLTDSFAIARDPGVYSVKIHTAGGCVNTAPEITITILPNPVPPISRTGRGFTTVLSTAKGFSGYEWQRDGIGGTSVEGAGPDLPVSKKGLYRVIVTDANGCTGSASMNVLDDELGIPENPQAAEIKVYPNPTASRVYIESPVPVCIQFADQSGKMILKQCQLKEASLDGFADGSYLLTITDEKGTVLKRSKIIKISR